MYGAATVPAANCELVGTPTRLYYCAAALACSKIVELRGFEPLTFSMRTRRATNCAIAPDTGSTGYQSRPAGRKPARLLTRGAGKVEVTREWGVVQVLEDRILVVDLQHHRTRPPQP